MGISKVRKKIGKPNIVIASALILAVFLALWIFVSFTCGFFAGLLVACLVLGIEEKYPLVASLVFLVLCSIALALNQGGLGNLLAVWGYGFFAVGALLLFIKLPGDPRFRPGA